MTKLKDVSSFAPRTPTMHTDIEEPVAFDRTPLTAAFEGAVGPRTPFSPERTFVTLPRGNPEIEPLAGASERQGATGDLGQPAAGTDQQGCQKLHTMTEEMHES